MGTFKTSFRRWSLQVVGVVSLIVGLVLAVIDRNAVPVLIVGLVFLLIPRLFDDRTQELGFTVGGNSFYLKRFVDALEHNVERSPEVPDVIRAQVEQLAEIAAGEKPRRKRKRDVTAATGYSTSVRQTAPKEIEIWLAGSDGLLYSPVCTVEGPDHYTRTSPSGLDSFAPTSMQAVAYVYPNEFRGALYLDNGTYTYRWTVVDPETGETKEATYSRFDVVDGKLIFPTAP